MKKLTNNPSSSEITLHLVNLNYFLLMLNLRPFVFFLFFLPIFIMSCAKKAPPTSSYVPQEPSDYSIKMEAEGWMDNPSSAYSLEEEAFSDMAVPKSAPRSRASGAAMKAEREIRTAHNSLISPNQAENKNTAGENTTNRKIHYSGSISHKAANPKQILDSAGNYVKSVAGYIERLQGNTIVLRVPADKFQVVFDSLLKFATVTQKSIWAEDITEAFQDNDLRIQLTKATVERLTQLLNKAEKDTDKMWILREIQRASEELEKLEEHKKWLENQAAFGRIDLNVQPYNLQPQPTVRDLAGFEWIRHLGPSMEKNPRYEDKIEFPVPSEMVLIRNPKIWKVVSADGAKFWAQSIENEPAGTTDFWASAVVERLKEDYATHTENQVGNIKLLRWIPPMENPYIYYVGLRQVGKKLYIVEVFYPSETQEKRYHPGVLESLEKEKS